MTSPIETRASRLTSQCSRLRKSISWPNVWVAPSKDWIVKQALAAWIDQAEERSRLTLEALADVGAGRVINHQTVQAWTGSLSTDNRLPVPR